MSQLKDCRNRQMIDLIARGELAETVGRMFGVSRQRVTHIAAIYVDGGIRAIRSEASRAVTSARKAERIRLRSEREAADAEAFHARFLDRLANDAGNGCIVWTGSITPDSKPGNGGYGKVRLPKQARESLGLKSLDYAHRVAYALSYGAIPEGMTVDHICFNRRCCNPDHLRLATKAQNSARKQHAASMTESNGGK